MALVSHWACDRDAGRASAENVFMGAAGGAKMRPETRVKVEVPRRGIGGLDCEHASESSNETLPGLRFLLMGFVVIPAGSVSRLITICSSGDENGLSGDSTSQRIRS